MQNWKPIFSLTSTAGSASTRAKLLHRLHNSPRAASLNTQSGAPGKSAAGGARRAPAPTISSSRKQSTTGANLAASQAPVTLRNELAGAPGEDEESEYEFDAADEDADDDRLIHDRLTAAAGEALKGLERCPETHRFVGRHIGPREADVELMLRELGYTNLNELIENTIPSQIRLDRELRLPEPLSEDELLERLGQLGAENEATQWKSFIGMGYYDCITPPVILRNLFENPGWTTAYTAYQAEIAQGRLESLMNYQTMVRDLTGLDVANASLLDEATAAAEAMQVCLRHHRSKRQKLLVSIRCHPQTRAVVETRAQALGVQVDYFDELSFVSPANGEQPKLGDKFPLKEYAGLLVQYPNSQGHLFQLDAITGECRAADCLVAVATDLLACALFKPPGDFGQPADLAVGSSQRLGVPLNYGGPHAGFMACSQRLVRSMPGRVVGVTRDSSGNQAYRFALQTREQHIRRDKATSNICTAQALLANMSAMYAVYHGPEGLREIAGQIHAKTSLLAHLIKRTDAQGVELTNDSRFFDTLTVRVSDQSLVRQRARQSRINLRYDQSEADGEIVSISLDETTKLADVFKLASLFGGSQIEQTTTTKAAGISCPSSALDDPDLATPVAPDLKRTSPFLTHPTFNSHRSEAQLVRYMKSLENKDISLTHSMIPLGSCTMKLNATSQMLASSWPQFTGCHPFQPADQCRGYQRLFEELDEYLCEITGYDRISFQPNSGAQGEYAGLRAIKSYLESRGQAQRNVCLIPISAHGTNPASAQMAGFQCQTIQVLPDGNIDLDDLRRNIERHGDRLACLMITYPSTYGVFEDGVREICDMVHAGGGQVYLDGANMNAQVGLCRPGDYGSDVSHLNLHKTFCIPHGGGGPGAGPIGVKSHLIPFLPTHPLVAPTAAGAQDRSFGTVSGSMWGSPAILPISWSYIRLMSGQLKRSSQVAILNANYMRARLEGAYKILYVGARGNVAHEFILDCRPFKKSANVEAIDIAKRLQDFGLHAPTVSWPVTNTLMVEPTESEDKAQLDNYCEALLAIRREIAAIESGEMDRANNPLKLAPHTQQVVCASHWDRAYSREQAAFPAPFVRPANKVWPSVGRVDDTYGDTNLFCSCPPPASEQTNAQVD